MGTTIVPFIWSKRLAHGDCPSATVRLRVAPFNIWECSSKVEHTAVNRSMKFRLLPFPPNRPLGFSCGLFSYEQANYHKSEVRKLVHGTNYYSSGWRLKGLTHNPKREQDGPCPCSAESGITGRIKDVMLPR